MVLQRALQVVQLTLYLERNASPIYTGAGSIPGRDKRERPVVPPNLITEFFSMVVARHIQVPKLRRWILNGGDHDVTILTTDVNIGLSIGESDVFSPSQ
jgi:hypothetical protein